MILVLTYGELAPPVDCRATCRKVRGWAESDVDLRSDQGIPPDHVSYFPREIDNAERHVNVAICARGQEGYLVRPID